MHKLPWFSGDEERLQFPGGFRVLHDSVWRSLSAFINDLPPSHQQKLEPNKSDECILKLDFNKIYLLVETLKLKIWKRKLFAWRLKNVSENFESMKESNKNFKVLNKVQKIFAVGLSFFCFCSLNILGYSWLKDFRFDWLKPKECFYKVIVMKCRKDVLLPPFLSNVIFERLLCRD